MVHITFNVDTSVKTEFKSLCAKHGDLMSEILRKRVMDYIVSKNVHIVKS